jgi:hypothetical protein
MFRHFKLLSFYYSESACGKSDNTSLTVKVVCDKRSKAGNVIFGIFSSCFGVGVLRFISVIYLISARFRSLCFGIGVLKFSFSILSIWI